MEVLVTPRLELLPITLATVEAVIEGDRARAERASGVRLPDAWPNPDLVARAFTVSLEAIRADPERRLWGDRFCVARGENRVVGSVVFHGRPGEDGVAEVGYGIELGSQRQGLASEAVAASVEWALAQPECRVVRAVTMPWHTASVRVLERSGLRCVGTADHSLVELLLYERSR